MARKREAAEREKNGLPPSLGDEGLDDEEGGGTPSREFMLMMLVGLGMTAEEAEKEYEAQLRMNEDAKRNGVM